MNPDYAGSPAWKQAWRLRCCPPEHMLIRPADQRLRDHLEICPWCRDTLELPPCPLPMDQPLESIAPTTPLPGHIYFLHSRLAGWGPKSRYYNPPAVLILSCPDEHSLFVAQIYGDLSLAGADDIVLPPDPGGFAQPWNCYTLMRDDVGPRLGKVDADLVVTLLEQRKQGELPLQPGSLLCFFRQMEVETGYYFAQQASRRLMMVHTGQSATLLRYTDHRELLPDLLQLPLKMITDATSVTGMDDLLAVTCADERLLPLAAADAATIQALVFTVEQGRLVAATVETLTLTSRDYADGVLTVTGLADCSSTEVQAWIVRWQSGTELIPPLPGQSGCEERLFWAAFPLKPHQADQPGTLIVRILRERRE
ncbi:hypothetical protein [Desulfobulbus alkaliphilus]|uniref:hypothetical protein n=1 Tax=Desulfobulbus alkaliphilus TaxID=869814 RepID=UPI001963D007|nr:hypothetical protein [Desulfobulbus alkaliphilus]MBM9536293.1 hypothetical protein [Desulfobulbus alkaliphilus]